MVIADLCEWIRRTLVEKRAVAGAVIGIAAVAAIIPDGSNRQLISHDLVAEEKLGRGGYWRNELTFIATHAGALGHHAVVDLIREVSDVVVGILLLRRRAVAVWHVLSDARRQIDSEIPVNPLPGVHVCRFPVGRPENPIIRASHGIEPIQQSVGIL